MRQRNPAPLTVCLNVNGTDLDVELDTGAVVSLITERTYKQKFSHVPMRGSTQKLHTYSGDSLKVVGEITADILHEGVHHQLLLMWYMSRPMYHHSWEGTVGQNQTQLEQNLRPTPLGEQSVREGLDNPRILASKVPGSFCRRTWNSHRHEGDPACQARCRPKVSSAPASTLRTP